MKIYHSRPRSSGKKERSGEEKSRNRTGRLFDPLFLFCVLLGIGFSLDYFLPRKIQYELIEDWYMELPSGKKIREYHPLVTITLDEIAFVIKTPKREIRVNENQGSQLRKGQTVAISSTFLFNTVTGIRETESPEESPPYFNSYGAFLVVPLLLAFIGGYCLWKKPDEDARITFGVLEILLLVTFVWVKLLFS